MNNHLKIPTRTISRHWKIGNQRKEIEKKYHVWKNLHYAVIKVLQKKETQTTAHVEKYTTGACVANGRSYLFWKKTQTVMNVNVE